VLVAFNAHSLGKFGPVVTPGGVVVYDSSVVREPPALDASVRAIGVPCSEIAADLGERKVKNAAALGALQCATGLFPDETFLAAIRQALQGKSKLVAVNEEAFRRGMRAVEGCGADDGWFAWWS
jgi:Pyruvate/2-oxoacid:ferredoxin oxidoreductase gamma subunit